MFAVRFLRQVRVPLSAAVTSPIGRIPRFGKCDSFNTWMTLEGLNSQVPYAVPKSSYKTFDLRRFCEYAQKLRNSGCKFIVGHMVACAVLGSMSLWPQIAYSKNGYHQWEDYPQTILPVASRTEENFHRIILLIEENFHRIILLIRKLLVPVFLFLTVWLNWGQSHPLFLAAKVTLIFLSTKPFPSSVYIFVDQLQLQIMSQQPFLYRFKLLQAKTVEVEDYTFLCLARVEIKDEKLMLIGILGGWWILPLSSLKEVFLSDRSTWRELIHLVKSRFRLAADMSCY